MSFEKFTGTRPVAPQHAFDAERLAAVRDTRCDASRRASFCPPPTPSIASTA